MKKYKFQQELIIINELIKQDNYIVITQPIRKSSHQMNILFYSKKQPVNDFAWNVITFDYNKKYKQLVYPIMWGVLDYSCSVEYYYSCENSKDFTNQFNEKDSNKKQHLIKTQCNFLKKQRTKVLLDSIYGLSINEKTLVKKLHYSPSFGIKILIEKLIGFISDTLGDNEI